MTMPMITSSAGLDERDEPTEVRFDLLVVEVREAVQHVLQRACGLPYFDHLDGHVGKHPAVLHRRRKRPSFADLLGRALELGRHVLVPQRPGGHFKRVYQRDAAAQQRRERARCLGR